MTRPRLLVVVGSTRPGRLGIHFGRWFAEVATDHDVFDVQLADLVDVGLPFLDEPGHPRLGRYVHQHTRDWSAIVDPSDAVVMVTPEYNHGMGAALKNAIDFLHREWVDKPVGFVSYGGVAAGTRAVQQLVQVVTTVKMVPVFDTVSVPFAAQHVREDGTVAASPPMLTAAHQMLDELARLLARTAPSVAQ
ncbi:NADPH-dependent FMN reductase [Aeromicrobium wangtongii]|uniref:NADPH-dependent FMN reductase n=1 Tax=Aeromicrobium wangtongii TaxID=2969247 RepID=UPI0020176A31|nr:NAD(P)H-dependent oxidoreductase [Aeromicrobium wangtongii]MCL3819403.1 NAD(P)H-dependent oxidoreductase [Aeromicrobium wangtongii]